MPEYDVIFIAPPFRQGNETMWKQFDYFFPPYGMAQIAAYVREKSYSVHLIDCITACPDLNDFPRYFRENYTEKGIRARFYGITAVTPIINHALMIGQWVRESDPAATIILGGPHPTHMAGELIHHPAIDAIVMGEGELTFLELLEKQEWKNIHGLLFKTRGEDGQFSLVRNPEREQIADLDTIPLPAYDLVDVNAYKAPGYSHRGVPSMSVVTSRGCTGRCSFCSKVFHKVSMRSPGHIMEELRLLYHQYGIRQIIFYDDTFTISRERIIRLCERIREELPGLVWTCFARVDTVDAELLKSMKTAGCEHVMYGVENFDTNVLQMIRKNISVDQVFSAVRATQAAGIECRVSLMIGNPGETKDTIKYNMKMIRKLKPDYLQVLIFHPLPGAPLYQEWREEGRITAERWEDFNFTRPVSEHPNLTPKQIRSYYLRMYAAFYLHPRFIFNELLKLNRKAQWSRIYWGGRALLSFFFKNLRLLMKGGKP